MSMRKVSCLWRWKNMNCNLAEKRKSRIKTAGIFLTFLKIGAFTFGGGYAMIALLKNEFVDKKHWIAEELFYDLVSVAETTPGPLSVNCATYIGYRIAGFYGAVMATTAVCLPSFGIIYFISLVFGRFTENAYVKYALDGIQVCVVYLILSASVRMLKGIPKCLLQAVIFVVISVIVIASSLFDITISTPCFILGCGLMGILFHFARRLRGGR